MHDKVGIKFICQFRKISPLAVIIEPRRDVVGRDNFDFSSIQMASHAIDDIYLDRRMSRENPMGSRADNQQRLFTLGQINAGRSAKL